MTDIICKNGFTMPAPMVAAVTLHDKCGYMELNDIATEQDIQTLVDTFYKKVLADELIGPIFNDVAKLDWDKHMPIMYSFWGSMLLGTQSYRSNPMTKHINLDKLFRLEKVHFNRWLEIWEQNLKEHFFGEIAEQALTRARNIASVMEYKVRSSRNKTSLM